MTNALQVHTGEPGTALERRPPALLRPLAPPAEIIQAQEQARELVTQALKAGRDYGEVPGTDRQTLLKPGAERLSIGFGLVPRFRVLEKEADHDRVVQWRKVKKIWERGTFVREDTIEGQSLGLYRVVIECELVHRETGEVVGSSIASCSTLESKYIERPRDSENTVYKMASKRAHVGATLNALGLSDQFTQDVEDTGPAAAAAESSSANASEPGAGDGPPPVDNERSCPKCGGKMWDNRQTKRSPKAPDFKCRDRSCDGVIWPPKPGDAPAAASASSSSSSSATSAAPLGSLEWAQALPLMGKPTSWTHEGISYGRKPIGTVPTPALKQAGHFIKDLLAKNPDDERASALREQVQAIALVVDERAKLDPKQEEMPLAGGAPVATVPAPDPSAEQLAAAGAAVREPEDDDLPF